MTRVTLERSSKFRERCCMLFSVEAWTHARTHLVGHEVVRPQEREHPATSLSIFVRLFSFAQIWPEKQEIMDKPSGPVYSYKRHKLMMQEMSCVQESICKNAGDLQWILILHQDFFDFFTQFLTEHQSLMIGFFFCI